MTISNVHLQSLLLLYVSSVYQSKLVSVYDSFVHIHSLTRQVTKPFISILQYLMANSARVNCCCRCQSSHASCHNKLSLLLLVAQTCREVVECVQLINRIRRPSVCLQFTTVAISANCKYFMTVCRRGSQRPNPSMHYRLCAMS